MLVRASLSLLSSSHRFRAMSSSSTAKPTFPLFLITHEFYPVSGGIATFAEEIAKASATLGYDVEVWAQSSSGEAEKPWPFRMRRMPLKGTHDLICQFKLARELVAKRRQLRNATVYLPEPGPMLTMMLLQFFTAFRPKRLVLTFHGTEILKFSESPIRRWLAGRLTCRPLQLTSAALRCRGPGRLAAGQSTGAGAAG